MIKLVGTLGAFAVVAAQALSPVLAQEYPKKKPIKIVVATAVGGGSDTLARITAEFLQRRLGQAVIVENKPGAAGAIGIEYVARAPADGYTLLFQGSDFSVLPAVRRKLPYKVDELTYLMRCFSIPPVILGSPSLPAHSVPELVAQMKKNPGMLTYGSSGSGGIIHLAISLFEDAAGVHGTHIPYLGSSPSYAAMLGGHLDFTEGIVPFPDGLKVLGTAGSRRHPAYPNSPTLEEVGLKNASWDIWYGLIAPPNMPKDIQERLTAELSAVMQDPVAIEKFAASVHFSPDLQIGDDFKKAVLAEVKRWKAVADARRIVLLP